jgi:ribonuclease BN (tRNA processing enzyme)
MDSGDGVRGDHAPVVPAYGYRIDCAAQRGGDGRREEKEHRKHAAARLLIHDSLSKTMILMGARPGQLGSGAGRRSRGHHYASCDAVEAAENGRGGEGRTLVLTHEVPPLTTPAMEKLFLQGVAEAFSGQVVLAHDGARFDLPAK